MINAEFVEKALLGAILNEPTRREEVPWLEVNDFTNPLCRALWQHFRTGVAPHLTPPIDYVTLSDALRGETDLHPRLTAPSQIAELQIQAPGDADPVAYGRILVELAIRKQLICLGLKIGTVASQNIQPDHAELLPTLDAIADLGHRWQRIHLLPPSAPSLGDSQGSRRLLATPVTGRGDGGRQIEPSRELALAEMAALKAAVHDSPKGSRSLLLARLRPGDFSQPKIAVTFHAVEHLNSTGSHVDEITVAWELVRGFQDWGPGLDLNELRRDALVGQIQPGDLQTVTSAALHRSMTKAGTELVRAAKNLRADLPTFSERASAFLGKATGVTPV